MGIFGRSKKNKELKEAQATLKHLSRPKPKNMVKSKGADPTKAMTELQPWEVNQEKPRQGLSQLSHKDVWGRDIKEPDLSNPTRNRWERPLETINSFQESIDRGYRRSYSETEASPPPTEGASQNGRYHAPQEPSGYSHYSNRMGNSGTPLSNNSTEGPVGFGVLGGRTALNDDHVMVNHRAWNSRARNYSNASGVGGYPDTGYGESLNGSHGSSGNLDVEHAPMAAHALPTGYKPGPLASNGGLYSASPLQQQISAPSAQKNIIKLSNTAPPAPPTKQPSQKKGWIKRRSSKK